MNRIFFFLFALILPFISQSHTLINFKEALSPENLRCEYLRDPLGLDVLNPRLSWILKSEERGQRQTAYQVIVSSSKGLLEQNQGDLWNSEKVITNQSIQVEYKGVPLESRQQCYWKVRVWDKDGKPSSWSEIRSWSMGLLDNSDWKHAKWIGFNDSIDNTEPWLRKSFFLNKKPKRVFAYICSLYFHELYINGKKVSDAFFSPAVSQLDKRSLYITYDITNFLNEGSNVIGIWLGNGSFRPWLPGVTKKSPIVLAQIEGTLIDTTSFTIVTDESWKGHASPWSVEGLLAEKYDATKEIDDWCDIDLDDNMWKQAEVVENPNILISSQKMQPNRITREIAPLKIREIASGEYEIDMGRNYVGQFQMNFRDAERGDRIDLKYFENILTSELKQGFGQHDIYIAKGINDIFRNQFDYKAFRYVIVSGLKAKPNLDDVRGYLINADMKSTADFNCSNDLLNKIHNTVDWTFRCVSMRGNIVDCPHRERLGYGAEGQTTMRTAMTHYDAAAMFTHWLEVWRDGQDTITGMISHVAPGSLSIDSSPGWGGICITAPWELYLRYGDKRILEKSYNSMLLWIDFLTSKSENNLLQHYGNELYGSLADWVAPGRQLVDRWTNAVPRDCDLFFNNCYFIYNLQLVSKTALILGKTDDVKYFDNQIKLFQKAVHREFYDSLRDVYVNGEQSYQVMALLTGVVPSELQNKLDKTLELLIKEARKGHLNTGVLGTFFLLNYLLQEDRNDLIYEIVNQVTYPGWGWLIENGATTIGEQWGGGASQIHSSFLSVNSWFIEGVGGIQIDEKAPGYTHFFIKPPLIDIAWANTSYNSIHGVIATEWYKKEGQFNLIVEIPSNTESTVYLPTNQIGSITEGDTPIGKAKEVKFVKTEGNWTVLNIGSGKYCFKVISK